MLELITSTRLQVAQIEDKVSTTRKVLITWDFPGIGIKICMKITFLRISILIRRKILM